MVAIENLSISFGNHSVLQNFDAIIKRGEKAVFTGESGTGKTTLVNALLGFLKPNQGKITIMDYEVNKETIGMLRSNIAYVPQELNPPFTKVSSIIFEPFSFRQNKDNMPTKEEIKDMLNYMSLPMDILEKNLGEISGGQKQRIFLATAFLLKKPLVILDEPTTGLDENNIKKISKWMADQKDLTILATSHNKTWKEHSDKSFNLEDYGTNA